jgi:CheY-like chemotaxis protein
LAARFGESKANRHILLTTWIEHGSLQRGALGKMLTILLVDDDPLQAFVRRSALEKRFSNVLRVTDAAEALCLVEQPDFSGKLGLVIMNEHMQGIGGPAFVAELHTRMPSLPILVLGGSSKDPSYYRGDSVRFLPRPFPAEKMLALASQLFMQNQPKTV